MTKSFKVTFEVDPDEMLDCGVEQTQLPTIVKDHLYDLSEIGFDVADVKVEEIV